MTFFFKFWVIMMTIMLLFLPISLCRGKLVMLFGILIPPRRVESSILMICVVRMVCLFSTVCVLNTHLKLTLNLPFPYDCYLAPHYSKLYIIHITNFYFLTCTSWISRIILWFNSNTEYEPYLAKFPGLSALPSPPSTNGVPFWANWEKNDCCFISQSWKIAG